MATTEEKVISAVCKNKDFHLVIGESNELFGPYSDVFDFMRDYYLTHKAVPEASLLEGRFGSVNLESTTAPTAFYLNELKNSFITGRMQEIMLKASDAMRESTGPDVLERLQTSLAKLNKYSTASRDIDITNADWAKEHFEQQRLRADANGGIPGIATGFKSIDTFYPTGMSGGHFIVGLGYTGRAKSMFADRLAVSVHEQGYKPMIISLEMSPEEQMERIYAMMSAGMFKISDLSRGDIAMDDFDTFSRKKLDKAAPFVVVSSEGISEVTPNIVQAKYDMHRPDIIILDYMQLMKDNAKTQAMTPRMLNLSAELKRLAVANNVPILALTAVTDDDGDKRDGPPLLSQIAWSSGIEYDANLALAIHRHDDSDLVEVVCRKNRHGGMFGFYFEVDFDAGIWTEKFDL